MTTDKKRIPRRHIIISGTGRTGTTFLVQLFTALGLDTGFADLTSAVSDVCNAGMEWDIRDPSAPHIVKSPWLCDHLDEALDTGEIIVEHAIVPMRDLYSAAESRRQVSTRVDPADFPNGAPGGLWHTSTPDHQELILACQLYRLIYTLAVRDIPVTLLHFPWLVRDAAYLYRNLAFLLEGVPFEQFKAVFKQVAKPQMVHDFTPNPNP